MEGGGRKKDRKEGGRVQSSRRTHVVLERRIQALHRPPQRVHATRELGELAAFVVEHRVGIAVHQLLHLADGTACAVHETARPIAEQELVQLALALDGEQDGVLLALGQVDVDSRRLCTAKDDNRVRESVVGGQRGRGRGVRGARRHIDTSKTEQWQEDTS